MLQKVRKWTQINQGQLGRPFGIHLGASGRLQSQVQAIPGQILTFPDPPCKHGQLKWSEIACTGVQYIVLHISCSNRTYWEHFRPSKVSFSSIAERSSLLLRQYDFWKYCFKVIFFKCFVLNVSYASIFIATQRPKTMDISLIGWPHLGSLIVKNLRQPWHTYLINNICLTLWSSSAAGACPPFPWPGTSSTIEIGH